MWQRTILFRKMNAQYFPGNIILKQILQLTSSSVIFAFSQFCQAILVSSRSCVAVSTHAEECSRAVWNKQGFEENQSGG